VDEVLKKNKSGLVQFMIYPGEFTISAASTVLRDA